MNRSKVFALVLGVTALAASGIATDAVAQKYKGSDGSGWNRGGSDRNRGSSDFTGVWRLNERGDHGQHDDWDRTWDRDRRSGGSRLSQLTLPDVFRIERGRSTLRVEDRAGRLLREIRVGRRGDWDERVRIERTGFGGARITEVLTLRGRGDRLVVQTTISGPRGSREFTSVYARA